jgi:hypothetical protein
MPRRLDGGSQNHCRIVRMGRRSYSRNARRCAKAFAVASVVDHRVFAGDPFRLTENAAQRKIPAWMLGDHEIAVSEVGELLSAT